MPRFGDEASERTSSAFVALPRHGGWPPPLRAQLHPPQVARRGAQPAARVYERSARESVLPAREQRVLAVFFCRAGVAAERAQPAPQRGLVPAHERVDVRLGCGRRQDWCGRGSLAHATRRECRSRRRGYGRSRAVPGGRPAGGWVARRVPDGRTAGDGPRPEGRCLGGVPALHRRAPRRARKPCSETWCSLPSERRRRPPAASRAGRRGSAPRAQGQISPWIIGIGPLHVFAWHDTQPATTPL